MKNRNFANEKLKNLFNEKTEGIKLNGDISDFIDNLPPKEKGQRPQTKFGAIFKRRFLVAAAGVIICIAAIPLILQTVSNDKGILNQSPEGAFNDTIQTGIFETITAQAQSALLNPEVSDSVNHGKDYGGVKIDYAARFTVTGDSGKSVFDICGDSVSVLIAEFALSGESGVIISVKGQKGGIKLLGEKTEQGYIFTSQKALNGKYPYTGGSLQIKVNNNSLEIESVIYPAEAGSITRYGE